MEDVTDWMEQEWFLLIMLNACHSRQSIQDVQVQHIHSVQDQHSHDIPDQHTHSVQDHSHRCCKEGLGQPQLRALPRPHAFHSSEHSQDVRDQRIRNGQVQHIHSDQDQHSHDIPDQHTHSVQDHSHRCCKEGLGQPQHRPQVQPQPHAFHNSDHSRAHEDHTHIHNV